MSFRRKVEMRTRHISGLVQQATSSSLGGGRGLAASVHVCDGRLELMSYGYRIWTYDEGVSWASRDTALESVP